MTTVPGTVTAYDPLTNRCAKRLLAACRDCGWRTTRDRFTFFRGAPPRCTQCGGLLDAVGVVEPKKKKKKRRK
jgi:hypothetical protein